MKYSRYTFLAPIHFLKINTFLSKGIAIKHNIRISNNNSFIANLFCETDIIEHIGQVGLKELDGSTYVYAQGDIPELYERFEGASTEIDVCFLFLREVSAFLSCLWEVEDHSSYVRDGFMYLHNLENPKNGGLYRASLSAVPSTCEGFHVESEFSRENILEAKKVFESYDDFSFKDLTEGGKYPLANPLDKELSRLERSKTFVSIARDQSILPLKVFNYCTALECLFTTDNSEVSHKNAERVASLIGTDVESKLKLFRTVKKAYGVRSKLTHGQPVNVNVEQLRILSMELDTMLREIYKKNLDEFNLNSNDLENYYLQLVFNS